MPNFVIHFIIILGTIWGLTYIASEKILTGNELVALAVIVVVVIPVVVMIFVAKREHRNKVNGE